MRGRSPASVSEDRGGKGLLQDDRGDLAGQKQQQEDDRHAGDQVRALAGAALPAGPAALGGMNPAGA